MLHIVLIFSIFYLIFFIFLKILAYIKNNYYLCPEFAKYTLQFCKYRVALACRDFRLVD